MMKKLLLVLGMMLMFCGNAFAYSTPRWSNFPVNVYIQQDENASIVQRAFQTWQANSGSVLRFFCKTNRPFENTSQINVYFTDLISDNSYYEIERSLNGGYYTIGFFVHLDIKIRTTEPGGKRIAPEKLYAIAMHAIGRAVGVNCLTAIGNVMSCRPDYSVSTLTASDIEALNSVYKYEKSNNVYKKKYAMNK